MKFLLIASGLFIANISSLTIDVEQEVDSDLEVWYSKYIIDNIDLFYRKIHQEEEPGSSGARFTKEIVLLDVQVRIGN